MQHRSCCTYNSYVLPLHDPILLWVMRRYEFSSNSFFAAEVLEFVRDVFSTIITPKSLHLRPQIFLHKYLKLKKLRECLIFLLHEEDPTLTRKFINKYHIVLMCCCQSNREWSTHVCVNSFKDPRSSVLLLMKGSLYIFYHSKSLACV